MAKRGRMPFPKPMTGIMQESLQSLGLADRLRDAEIWRIWPDAVGSAIAARTQPLRIINGVLTVAVSSAPWMQELRFMTGMIKEKLNGRLDGEVVREIVLKSGRVNTLPVEPPEMKIPKKRLTPHQKQMIEENSSSIEDPETRQAFAELMKASLEN